MNSWIKGLVAIVLIWSIAAVVVWGARSARATPEKLADYISQNPIADAPPAERIRIIQRVTSDLNRLDFEQRRSVQRSSGLRELFEDLTPTEKEDFVEATLPEGFRQMMLAFNKMDPERRQTYVDRALSDLERRDESDGDPEVPEFDREATQKIIDQGLQAFYSEASADVKLDFAPVIERLQDALQSRR